MRLRSDNLYAICSPIYTVFMELYTFYVIAHLFGAILGAGGAYLSDGMFLLSVKDSKINRTEFKFLELGSTFVWGGLVISYISGFMLFLGDPEFFMDSDKFLAKVTIVLILTVNGYFFHKWHLPLLDRHVDKHFLESKEFMRARGWLIISGAISIISWTTAIVLGAWREIPFDYFVIMQTYLLFVVSAAFFARMSLREQFCMDHK